MPRTRDEILNDIMTCESKIQELQSMPNVANRCSFTMRIGGFGDRFFSKERFGYSHDLHDLEEELRILKDELRYYGRIC